MYVSAEGLAVGPAPIELSETEEKVSFVPGVDLSRSPSNFFGDVRSAFTLGSTIRKWHDAGESYLASLTIPGEWFPLGPQIHRPGDVVCHNDLVLSNIIQLPDGTMSPIDWEMATPGNRWFDIASAAWHGVPLYHPIDRERLGIGLQPSVSERLTAFLDGYWGAPASSHSVVRLLHTLRRSMVWTMGVNSWAYGTTETYLENWKQVSRTVFHRDIESLEATMRAISAVNGQSMRVLCQSIDSVYVPIAPVQRDDPTPPSKQL